MKYVWYFPEIDKIEILNQFMHNEFISVYKIGDWNRYDTYLGKL